MDIKTTCLGVLAKGNASGYEIRKEFEDGPFSHFAEGGFGSIYPALNRLSEEGLVTFEKAEQDKRPDKKVYQITDRGRQALVDALSTLTPGEDKYKSDLLFLLFFAEALPAAHIARVIDARIAWYAEKIDHIAEHATCENPVGCHLVGQFGVTVYRSAMEFLETHRQDFINLAADSAKPVADAAE